MLDICSMPDLRILLVIVLCAGALPAQDAVHLFTEPILERPTLHCVGIRWPVRGDQDRDARVTVGVRKKGSGAFKPSGELLRVIPSEALGTASVSLGVRQGWTFAGSVVDLEPGTAYQLRISVEDPDGGGDAVILEAKTRTEPKLPKGMEVRFVKPGDGGGDGTRADPFRGLVAALEEAKPGQVLVLAPGVYVRDEADEGSLLVKVSGEPGRPIVIRGEKPGKAILDGGGDALTKGSILAIHGRQHLWLEDLVFVGRRYAMGANKTSDCVVRGCSFRDVGSGFGCYTGDAETAHDHFIADNVYEGPGSWPPTKGVGDMSFVTLAGQGHVVCHNLVRYAGDGVRGQRTETWSGCDVYRNVFIGINDDAVEADHAEHNIRIFENLIVDAMVGVSFDSLRGGPAYCFRNVIYNTVFTPFRLHNNPTGVVLYHNTSLRAGDAFPIQPGKDAILNFVSRNNLFLGSGSTGLVVGAKNRVAWDLEADGYAGHDRALVTIDGKSYRYPAEVKEAGLVYSRLGVWDLPPGRIFAKKLRVPKNSEDPHDPAGLVFTLHRRSDAKDKGLPIPGFNDDYDGKRPDLGALEIKQKPPKYGPR